MGVAQKNRSKKCLGPRKGNDETKKELSGDVMRSAQKKNSNLAHSPVGFRFAGVSFDILPSEKMCPLMDF